jgi:hypothetical protein
MTSNDLRGREPKVTFWTDVLEQVRVSDIALMLLIPLVLTVVYLLPMPIQRSFTLDFANPSIVQLWSSAYVHNGLMHFINNVVAYCLFIAPSYVFFVLADERQLFRYIFFTFVLIAPPIIALVNIVFIGQGTGAGFSGIGAAFVGLLPVSIFVFIRNRVSTEVGPSNGTVIFLVVLGITASIYSGIIAAAGILVVSCLLLLFDIRRTGLEEVRRLVSELTSMNGYFMFMLVALALFLFSPVMLFPQEIVQDNHAVNILSHYAGLVFGFFGPAVFCIYRR